MWEMYVGLPKGVQGPVNLLRSLPHPPHKAHVRFLNRTNTPVCVVWVDFTGRLQYYKVLQHDQYFDCNTYADHAWVFKDAVTRDPMAVQNKEVFWPEPQYDGGGLRRTLVIIHRPMNSLRTLAARVVRNRMRRIIDPFFVEIPFHLQTFLVKMLLEFEEACHRIKPLFPSSVPGDKILRKDFDDFQYNITLICHRLSTHARSLLLLVNKIQGNGERVFVLSGILNTIVQMLHRFDAIDTCLDIPLRRLGPVIWKQIIFLRVHMDTLRSSKARLMHVLLDLPSSYDNLRHMVEKRRQLVPTSHRASLQRYHWEQLNLLLGDPVHVKPELIVQKVAYDIPEIIALDQRTEWKWIKLRQEQLRDYFYAETLDFFLNYTIEMVQDMDKLENIFQVLCILHYHLTGKHIPDDIEEEEPLLQKDTPQAEGITDGNESGGEELIF